MLPKQHLSDIGWGFIVAWGLSVIFTDTFTYGEVSNLGMFWLASMIGAPVGLLFFFFCKDPLRSKRLVDTLQLAAVAGMVIGTAMLSLSVWSDQQYATIMQIGSGIISSLGTAIFTTLWGDRYTAMDMQRIERSAAYSLMVAFICYACVLIVPISFSVIFIACFPFFSIFCLKGSAEQGVDVGKESELSTFRDFNICDFIRIGLGIVGVTTAVSLFWSMVSKGVVPLSHSFFELSVLSGTAVALLLMVYMARFSSTFNLGTLYRWALPLIALAFALLFIPGNEAMLMASLLVFATQALLNLLTFVYFAELSKRTNVAACKVFGLGRFFVEIGFLFGILLAPSAASFSASIGSYHAMFAIVLVVLIVLVMSSIGIQDRLAFTLEERPQVPSVSSKNMLEVACDQVSSRYGMTNREREILYYLAQGYSLPYVRNELYIAQSTIDTHVRHIYKKMDIHSKEELITEVRDST